MKLILYSKPGCHLCEGLEEKLEQIKNVELKVRNITTNDDWWQKYQYEIPVLYKVTSDNQVILIPRLSPRISVEKLNHTLHKY